MDSPTENTAVTLEPWVYQDMHWCTRCAGEQILIAVYEIPTGRACLCLGCGEEKFVPFRRTTAEAA